MSKKSTKIIQQAKQRKKSPRKKQSERFHIYIYRVLKQVHPDEHISSKAMEIMNSMVNDIFHRITVEASKIAAMNGRKTIREREIQTAVRLVFPGELGKHAVSEGIKAIQS